MEPSLPFLSKSVRPKAVRGVSAFGLTDLERKGRDGSTVQVGTKNTDRVNRVNRVETGAKLFVVTNPRAKFWRLICLTQRKEDGQCPTHVS